MNYPPVRSHRIAEEVRVELARQRRTVVEMSVATGISAATLRRRIAAESSFTLDEIALVAQWLKVPVTILIRRSETAA